MKTIKNLFLMLSIVAATMFGASAANAATCSAGWVNVTGVYEYNVNGTTYGYIYTVPEHSVLPTYTNYFVTYNQNALSQAKLAMQNHQTYYLYGDSGTAACPTTGSYRYFGTLSYLYEY